MTIHAHLLKLFRNSFDRAPDNSILEILLRELESRKKKCMMQYKGPDDWRHLANKIT